MSWKDLDGKEAVNTEPVVADSNKDSVDTDDKGGSSGPAVVAAGAVTSPETDGETAKSENKPTVVDEESQKVIGRVAKAIRERAKAEISEVNERLKALEDENRRLKEGSYNNTNAQPELSDDEIQLKIRVREEFLRQQEALARERYGQEYTDAIEIVKKHNDPQVNHRIQWAADPVATLFTEARRIAEEIEYGPDPKQREAKRVAEIEGRVRKQVEAEVAAKIAAMGKQPTDVQRFRVAGGDDAPKVLASWSTTLPR